MSFLIDPPLLFVIGFLVHAIGGRLGWRRHARIVVAAAAVALLWSVSALLYLDVVRCVFPLVCDGETPSEFMFHTRATGIDKGMVPAPVVVLLFALYPWWMFLGYDLALLLAKRRKRSSETLSYPDVRSRRERRPAEFAVERGPRPGRCVRDAVARLGGIGRFVREGDRVLIKANICGGMAERRGSYTSREVVGEVVDLVREAGGRPFVADADMIWTSFWPAAASGGWVGWAKEKGVELVNLSDTRVVNFDFGPGSAIGVERVSRDVVEADVIISVPVMKTHILTGVTLGMKNMYGTLPEVDKAKYHRKDIEAVICEVNKAFTPNLVVVDGSVGGEAVGPLTVQDVNFQTIIASNDVVCADAIACQLMGYDPMGIVHIGLAHERGLGDASKRFDLAELPYEHGGGKDGRWEQARPEVAAFCNTTIRLAMMVPGWESFMNHGADLLVYDASRMPVVKHIVPGLLRAVHDLMCWTLASHQQTEADVRRRRRNLCLVLLVLLAAAAASLVDGYAGRLSFGVAVAALTLAAASLLAALRMPTQRLAALVCSSAAVGYLVERLTSSAAMWTYAGGLSPPWSAIPAWALLMLAVIGPSRDLAAWLGGLGVFERLQDHRWRALPALAAMLALAPLMSLEGYLAVAGPTVLALYLAMAILGLMSAAMHPIEWNASLAAASVALGGAVELAGSSSGLWAYRFGEGLPLFLCAAWALNSFSVHALVWLEGRALGLDLDPAGPLRGDAR